MATVKKPPGGTLLQPARSAGKKSYAAPAITVYGNVEEITRGSSRGSFLDDFFPRGTPINQLTFS